MQFFANKNVTRFRYTFNKHASRSESTVSTTRAKKPAQGTEKVKDEMTSRLNCGGSDSESSASSHHEPVVSRLRRSKQTPSPQGSPPNGRCNWSCLSARWAARGYNQTIRFGSSAAKMCSAAHLRGPRRGLTKARPQSEQIQRSRDFVSRSQESGGEGGLIQDSHNDAKAQSRFKKVKVETRCYLGFFPLANLVSPPEENGGSLSG
ncbi:hypothetical protein CcaCcLH18_13374 [Colletotrichum camelliae]|nr:hypothetical protein CcaCcLH18_13374 [Colletotrichum camelliae]